MEIAVVGAGLAGLTFAAALRHRLGAIVTIFDERPQLGGGAAITLAPNALAALDHVPFKHASLGDAVRAIGAPADAASIRRANGTVIRRLDGAGTVRLLGEPVRVVDRGELQRLLLDAVGADRVRLGEPVRRVRPLGPGRVMLDLAGDRVETEAVVGADGFRSVVARALDPGIGASHAGYTAWRGVADTETATQHHGVVWGDRWEAGIAPMTRGRTYWFTTLAVAADRAEDPALWPPVRDRLVESGPPWADLLGAAPAPVAPIAMQDRSGPRRWSSGDVVVIGDAAHPMQPALGQGGAQAIVDAVLLASLLERRGARPAEVFAQFERLRRRRVDALVRASATAGRSLHGARWLDRAARVAAERMPTVVFEQTLRRVAADSACPTLAP